MSQKLRLPIIGSGTIKFSPKKPIFELKSPHLAYNYFASTTSISFIGGLLFKFTCPTTDYQSLTGGFLRIPVFIGQQYIKINNSINKN